MPDLTHRPSRYLTAVVVAAALAGTAVTTLQVRLGADPRLAAAQEQNAQMRREVERMKGLHTERDSRPVRRATVPVAFHAPAQAVVAKAGPVKAAAAVAVARPSQSGGPADCARYQDQESAQRAFVANRVALAAMDGNRNGKACEQLKDSAAARTGLPTRPEPVSPRPQPAPPAGPVLPTAPTKADILASGMHFGMSTGTTEEFGTLEASLRRQADMTGYFAGFDTGFDRDRVVAAWTAGQIPVMTWESRPLETAGDTTDYSLQRITGGAFDDYLTTYARAVAALGLPVVIRFDQEMNGNWYRWGEFENPLIHKGDYIAAWRHVHDIFQAAGANSSAIWLWSPNRIDNIGRFPGIADYYPGADYVDEVGMTGYLRSEDKQAMTFAGTYNRTLAELRRVAPGKPLLLSEVGATEDGGHKAAWLATFFPGLLANPDIAGFVWFDYAITSNGHTNDWRLDSTPASFAAFAQGLTASGYGLDVGKRLTLRPRGTPRPVTLPPVTLPPVTRPAPPAVPAPPTVPTRPAVPAPAPRLPPAGPPGAGGAPDPSPARPVATPARSQPRGTR